MKCPLDGTTLQITEREGVEIDYCPECRGIWLDRGELHRIIERAAARSGSGRSEPRERDREPEHGHGKSKNRLSFLGDLLGGD